MTSWHQRNRGKKRERKVIFPLKHESLFDAAMSRKWGSPKSMHFLCQIKGLPIQNKQYEWILYGFAPKIKVMRTCSEDKDDFSLAVFSYVPGMKYIQEIVKENGMKEPNKKVGHDCFDGCCAGATYSAGSSNAGTPEQSGVRFVHFRAHQGAIIIMYHNSWAGKQTPCEWGPNVPGHPPAPNRGIFLVYFCWIRCTPKSG